MEGLHGNSFYSLTRIVGHRCVFPKWYNLYIILTCKFIVFCLTNKTIKITTLCLYTHPNIPQNYRSVQRCHGIRLWSVFEEKPHQLWQTSREVTRDNGVNLINQGLLKMRFSSFLPVTLRTNQVKLRLCTSYLAAAIKHHWKIKQTQQINVCHLLK